MSHRVHALERQLADALDRIAQLEVRTASKVQQGVVAERDHEKGIRLRLGGTDDEPFLSPWLQPSDLSGVSRFLPDVGQQFMLLAVSGDLEQAIPVPLTHSDDKPNPATDADETVFYHRNDVRHSEKGGTVTTKAKGRTYQIDGDTKHDAKNITFTASGGGHLK